MFSFLVFLLEALWDVFVFVLLVVVVRVVIRVTEVLEGLLTILVSM